MPKIRYEGIPFDSELEVEYWKYLKEDTQVINFLYHPSRQIQITRNNYYTPDFIVVYGDSLTNRIDHYEIIETKGYNPYSKLKDDMIHSVMLSKTEEQLKEFCIDNGFEDASNHPVVYRKIKYLKAYGWVDFDFKNPNTISNKRKAKINEQKGEIKELQEFKKNAERYFRYHIKIVKNEKLTKSQKEWYYKYVEKIQKKYYSEVH